MALNWDNIIITTDEYSYSIDAEQRMIIFSGAPGSAGPAGPQGPAATIAVGTTTTLPAGSNATVENVGTDTAAVFNFGIPRGSSGGGGGDAMWGEIGGTLSDQTDLQTALDGKAAANHNHDGSYSALGHTHDDRYYTEAETDTLLAAKANSADLGAMAEADDAPHNGAEYVRKNSGWTLSNMGLMAEWGHVSGTLADQIDLSTALAAKANSADLGSIAGANYTISSTDLTDGTSPLATGDLYFYYEA